MKTSIALCDELSAVPSLEFVAVSDRANLKDSCRQILGILLKHGYFPVGFHTNGILQADSRIVSLDQFLEPADLDSLVAEFFNAASVAIRRRPVSLTFYGRGSLAEGGADSVRFTIGANFFPDDPIIMSVNICTSADEAWEKLPFSRDALIDATGDAYCWATVGYGYAVHRDKLSTSSAAMERLCMRYLGVGLSDPLGAFTSMLPHGFRSINWQTSVGKKWIGYFSQPELKAALNAAMLHHEGYKWTTGTQPSLCDRNNENDHTGIIEYSAIDRLLSPLIFVGKHPWFPRWDELTTERWGRRWSEVEVVAH